MSSTTLPGPLSNPLFAGMAVLAALALPSAAGWMLDPRELHGVSVWSKPLKFELSFGLHLATLLLAVRLLPAHMTGEEHRLARSSVLAVTLGCVLEALYIVLQAARGRQSHFNHDTPLETVLYYGAMGLGALVILAGTAALGLLLWRHSQSGQGSGLAYGMAVGLLLGSAATMVAVIPLSSGMVDGPGHWVGGVRSDANGLPLVGWSTSGGDLRVPHFFATHLMQVVPLAGWAADRLAPDQARHWTHVVAAAGLVIVVLTLALAIAGQPFLAP